MPWSYTAIVRGANDIIGIGVVQVISADKRIPGDPRSVGNATSMAIVDVLAVQ